MTNSYNDLNELQINNLLFFLDKSSKKHLDLLKEDFKEIKPASRLEDYRMNIIHALMMGDINFNYFTSWLSHVHLHGNNTLFVFEPDNADFFTINSLESLEEKITPLIQSIYNMNRDSIKGINIIGLTRPSNQNQLLITFASPCFIQLKNQDNPTEPIIKKDIYLAYLTIDYKEQHLVLSLHPTNNLINVNGIIRKQDMDAIVPSFMNFFKKQVAKFNYKSPHWIYNALARIIEEYYSHNNPIIDKKKEEFKEESIESLLNIFASKEAAFKRADFQMRIKRSLLNVYEDELIEVYKPIEKETPFKVHLHEAGKGITSFVANSKGKPLNFADSRSIVKMMTENTEVISLGITYNTEKRTYPYKISKSSSYYSLKRINNAGTEKEIVDDVLYSLKKYKHETEIKSESKAN